jgi:hypothetical protein
MNANPYRFFGVTERCTRRRGFILRGGTLLLCAFRGGLCGFH